MKPWYTLLLISLCFQTVNAQILQLDWAKNNSGPGDNVGEDIITDAAGNVYTVGTHTSNIDLDPSAGIFFQNSAGQEDIFIQKLDANGNFIWGKSIGGSGEDVATAIDIDAAGNLYITGFFENTVDFDPGVGTFNVTSSGGWETFILKLNSAGNLVWVKTLVGQTNTFDRGQDLVLDNSGNVLICGFFNATVDFDPGAGNDFHSSVGLSDLYILKLDNAGNYVWAKTTGGNNIIRPNAVNIDQNDNIYITGYYIDTADFDPGLGISNLIPHPAFTSREIFVLKLDASGNYLWAESSYGPGSNRGIDIRIDEFGNSYIVGKFNDTVDVDPGPTVFNLTATSSSQNIFILKLNSQGNFI